MLARSVAVALLFLLLALAPVAEGADAIGRLYATEVSSAKIVAVPNKLTKFDDYELEVEGTFAAFEAMPLDQVAESDVLIYPGPITREFGLYTALPKGLALAVGNSAKKTFRFPVSFAGGEYRIVTFPDTNVAGRGTHQFIRFEIPRIDEKTPQKTVVKITNDAKKKK